MDERLLHETKIHGTVEFPFAVYLGRVPEYITAFPRHWHEEAELIYVTAGRLNVSVWAQNYLLGPGDIVIVLPHAIHAIEQAQSEKAEYYNISTLSNKPSPRRRSIIILCSIFRFWGGPSGREVSETLFDTRKECQLYCNYIL